MKTGFSTPRSLQNFLIMLIQGALIGLGSVLPGISGGVLSVVFGIYKPLMELLADPAGCWKTHLKLLFPYLAGALIGFMGVAKVLAFFLESYSAPSTCLFVGLIAGLLPSLFAQAGARGRNKGSYLAMVCSMALVFALLICLKLYSVSITPGFLWYFFCGICFAVSVIAPGMSFSTLLMPLNLYTPFIAGLGRLDPAVLLPSGIGTLITISCLSKAVNYLFRRHYSLAFHGITGIVIAATVMIIPFQSFALSISSCMLNLFWLSAGILISALLDHFHLS